MGFIDGQRHRSYLGRRGLEASADTTPSSTVDAQHRSCCGGSATGGTNRRKAGRRPARVRAGQGEAARGSARPEAATMARAVGRSRGGGCCGRKRCGGGGGSRGSLGGGRRRRNRGKWRRRAGHARGKGGDIEAAVMVARVGGSWASFESSAPR